MEEDSQEHRDKVRETLSEFQSLLKSPAWARLVEVANEQIEVRKNILLSQEEQDWGDLLEGVRLKAEIRAIRLWLVMPESIVEQMKEELGYAAVEDDGGEG